MAYYKGQYSVSTPHWHYFIDRSSHIRDKMFSIIIFLFLSSVKAQFYPQQQQQRQYSSNNYNPWSSYPQNNPFWNQGIQQSKSVDRLFILLN
jgi:hypothetical protein